MAKPVRPTSPPPPGPQEQESQVHSRASAAPATRQRLSSAPGELLPHERLERKLRIARELLDRLPASDSRGRLLSIAVLRRDEALLDGVLASLARDEL